MIKTKNRRKNFLEEAIEQYKAIYGFSVNLGGGVCLSKNHMHMSGKWNKISKKA